MSSLNKDKFILEIDEKRIEVDSLIQNAQHANFHSAVHKREVINSLKMGKSWLGRLKGELGSISPYKVVSKHKDIPETKEVYQGELCTIEDELEFVNLQRSEIKIVTDWLSNEELYSNSANRAYQKLSEARFWYGFELGLIRDCAIENNES